MGQTLGDVKPRSTPTEMIEKMEKAQYKDWVTKDSDRRCPICLDDVRFYFISLFSLDINFVLYISVRSNRSSTQTSQLLPLAAPGLLTRQSYVFVCRTVSLICLQHHPAMAYNGQHMSCMPKIRDHPCPVNLKSTNPIFPGRSSSLPPPPPRSPFTPSSPPSLAAASSTSNTRTAQSIWGVEEELSAWSSG